MKVFSKKLHLCACATFYPGFFEVSLPFWARFNRCNRAQLRFLGDVAFRVAVGTNNWIYTSQIHDGKSDGITTTGNVADVPFFDFALKLHQPLDESDFFGRVCFHVV